jgi:riboflavin kinase/FMN adenylyltransferase
METVFYSSDFIFQQKVAATLGFFDGVHQGHQALINQLKEIAKEESLPTAVITFDNHPRKVLNQGYQPKLLTSLEERIFYLGQLGIDYCYILPFTQEFSNLSSETFITNTLYKQLKVKTLLIGYDHRFGKDRTGDFEHIQKNGKDCGMKVFQSSALQKDGIFISSTIIRHYLEEGDIKTAEQLLTHPYSLEGIVVKGDQLGRKIGFPTANIELTDKDKLIPKDGVYSVEVIVEGTAYLGLVYIGNRPTVNNLGEKRIEAHILNFNRDIYKQSIRITFKEYLRKEIKFDSIEELKKQLQQDSRE